MNDELILLRFVEIERNIRNIQEDIDEVKSNISGLYNDIDILEGKKDTDIGIDTINNKLKFHNDKFNRLESRLHEIGKLFRDTFAPSSFSKSG